MYINKHKILTTVISTTMAITAFTNVMGVSALSANEGEFNPNALYTSGKCGDSASWVINSDSSLIISGTGEMTKFYEALPDNDSRLYSYYGWENAAKDITEIIVEDGITVVDANAFDTNLFNNIQQIILPPSLTQLNGCLSPDAGQYPNLKDIYIYSKNISDASTINNTLYNSWSKVDTVWHVYSGSTTEASLRENLLLNDNQIEYIPNNEQMPTVNNKTAVEFETVTETSGPSGLTSKYEWDETSKTLTFSGKGTISIADYFVKYRNTAEHIVINSGITSICAYTGVILDEAVSGAFYNFTALKDVKLPDTLREIKELSFYGAALTNINLPESLIEIDDAAFKNCSNLEDISFPESLNKIGDSVFQHCSKLKSINLHEGMTIGGRAFAGCESLKELSIPKNVRFLRSVYIAQGMSREPATFMACKGLEKIVIEDGCWLGDAFDNEFTKNGIADQFCLQCYSLKTVVIKGDVHCIRLSAFGSCTSLTDIYLYNTGLTTITAKGTSNLANGGNPNVPDEWRDSFWTGNNPTFHVVKGSTTEQTLRDAGYLTTENTEYLTDFTALDAKIKEADNLDTSKYTDDSVAALKSAIDSGKTVLNNENATQEQVDSALTAIENAIKNLKSKVSPTIPTGNAPIVTTTRSPEVVKKDKTTAENLMKQAKITKLTVKSKAKKKINVTWKKVKTAVGYQVQVSKKSNFKKRILNKFTTKKKLTINKKIKSGKTYFVRVRAYATYKDAFGKPQKVYSKWNKKLRKVKVK